MDVFLVELSEAYNTVWDTLSADIKKNLIASLSAIKNFQKPISNHMIMKVKNFMIKNSKGSRNHTFFLSVISLNSALKKDDSFYPQDF